MVKIAPGFVEDESGFAGRKAWPPQPLKPLTPEEQAAYEETQRLNAEYAKEYRKKEADNLRAIKRLKKHLRAAGVQIEISGCGCCDSPTVTYVDNGKTIEIPNANVSTL
jgi:hypothetical protein